MKNLFFAFVVFLLLFSGCSEKEAQQRSEQAIIIDKARVLQDNPQLLESYKEFNDYLLQKYDIDFRVMTVANSEDIDLFANRAFAQLQSHSRSKSGKALLLVLNTLQDKVRLEVSTALEPIYTDAYVSYIERKGFVPYFQDNKIADGIYMAMELVKDRADEASLNKEFMEPMASRSIGAGAKTKAYIGKKDPEAKKGEQVAVSSQETPKDVIKKYMQVLKTHNKNPNLEIYSNSTKEFFSQWTVTDINQNNELRFLSKCLDKQKVLYDSAKRHAVLAVLPYDENRQCAPYFFKKEHGAWKLDIVTMAQSIRFNTNMQWHFDLSKRLENEGIYYAYAFDGYGFDNNGYPHRPKKTLDPKLMQKIRWGYTCKAWAKPGEEELAKTDYKKFGRCWISYIYEGMPAQVRLGLQEFDYIYSVGEGMDKIEDVRYGEFMDYMKNVPSGAIVTIEVVHYDPLSRKSTRVIRRGIAP